MLGQSFQAGSQCLNPQAAVVYRHLYQVQIMVAQELERLVRSVSRPIAVDLAHLMHADNDGLEVIHALQREGAELRGVNAMVKFLLQETTH